MNISAAPWRAVRAALVPFLLAASPLAAGAKCSLDAFEIPVQMSGGRAVAKLRMNGTETPMTLDSGAFFSAITEAAAAQLKLPLRRAPWGLRAYGLTGRVDYQLTRVERLGFQNAEIADVEFLVGGNEPGAGTMGLLGRNLLGWADTEYDLGHGAVRMMKPKGDCAKTNMAYWAKDAPVVEVPLLGGRDGDRFPPIKVEVRINGHEFTAVFDTGAQSILSRKAAKKAGLLDDERRLVPAGRVFGVGRGEAASWFVPFDTFELGGERISNNRLRVADFELDDADMLIGIDYFLSHRLFVARSQERLYLTYHGGPVFDLSIKAATPPASSEADEPRDATAFARRGSAFLARLDTARALSDFNRAIELEPAMASHFAARARVRAQLHQLPDALSDVDEALRLDPALHEARFDRVRLNLARRDIEAALEDLRLLDRGLAPQADLRRAMGDVYGALGRPELAFAQYEHWIAFHRKEVDLHSVQNNACWSRALAKIELDKALAACNGALDARPDHAAYLDSRGLVLLRQGQFADAIADYDRALERDPKLAWSLLGRGLARIGLNERERGMADLAAARQLRPAIEAEARRHGLELP